MRILFLSAYYEPEIAASLYLFSNISEALVKAGHIVDVFTPIPRRGVSNIVTQKYRKMKIENLLFGKLKIHRFWIPKEKKNTMQRMLRYLYLNFVLFFKSLFFKTDVIFLASTPPTNGLMGGLLRKIKKVPVVYNLQDIFPDSLVNTGIAREESLSYVIGKKIEQFTYRNVDQIIVISEDFKQNIIKKGVRESKISVVYNWVDENAVFSINRRENKLIKKYGLKMDSFYITYCGNIGFTQNLDMLFEIATKLKEYTKIEFIIIGEGAYKEEFMDRIMKSGLKNMKIFPFQPYEDISHVFSLGDVGLIISKAKVGENSVPSKAWSIMSAERPILASFDKQSELCRVIQLANCGICVDAEDEEKFTEAILYTYKNKASLPQIGKNGREYIMNNLTRDVGTLKIVKVIENAFNKKEKEIKGEV